MAITWNATSGILTVADAASLQNLGPVTYSLWVNPASAGEGGLGRFFMKKSATTENVNCFMSGSNTVDFQVTGSTTLDRRSSNASGLTLNVWTHLLITWDGVITTASSVHFYQNNSETSYQTTTNGATRTSDAGGNFEIGNNAADTRTFDGKMTEFAIWNKVLSSTEISLLYGGGTPGKGIPLQIGFGVSLVAYWPMDEDKSGAVNAAASYVKDKSGLGNHGTEALNTCVYSAEPTNLPYPSKPVSNKLRPRPFAPGIAR